MKQELNIALVQTDLVWEEASTNRARFEKLISELVAGTDLIVFPEMFTTGFTMFPEEVAESMKGDSLKWMKKVATDYKLGICGSLVIEENGNFFNRFVLVDESGKVYAYDKRHTFTLSGEDKSYQAGDKKVIIDFKGWKICPQVCYDLRFPVWSRNVEDYDLLIYVANWPQQRIDAWDALLKARGIENMCYCIGVNRIGTDGNGYEFNGHSVAYDGLGNRLTDFETGKAGLKIVSLNKEHLEDIRDRLRFLEDRDSFSLEV
ncbi:MAG: amidohydrolase [Bacteroidia bacterium]|nr:amidohydrolase [Bacteroidia bacterium]